MNASPLAVHDNGPEGVYTRGSGSDPRGGACFFLLPDGYPSTSDGDPAILRSGLHARVAEVGEQGIELVGIGTRDDAVEAFYPHAVVVRKLHEPPAVAFATLSRVLVQRSRRGEGGGRVACRKRLRVIPSVTPPP